MFASQFQSQLKSGFFAACFITISHSWTSLEENGIKEALASSERQSDFILETRPLRMESNSPHHALALS